MFLYPYKIFALSKNKRLTNFADPNKPVGIYDVEKNTYKDICEKQELLTGDNIDTKVSILLGDVVMGIKLICLDLDDCFLPTGEVEPLTKELLKEFKDEEYEVSSSGEGIHVYILTKMNLETFIVKEMEGCKSFECYTNKRHIVTTYFDFENTDLKVGIHDKFLEGLYKRANEARDAKKTILQDVKMAFGGVEVSGDEEVYARTLTGREPVMDMYKLRGLGYKDPAIIEVIDENPDAVDQSAHDAKLIRKLMYYCLSFDNAWEMAKKTNYYRLKDEKHKRKFNSDVYKERTRAFLARG